MSDVILVRKTRSGLDTTPANSVLDLVLYLLNNGSLGGDNCWGDDAHLGALEEAERYISYVRERIAAFNERDGQETDEEKRDA